MAAPCTEGSGTLVVDMATGSRHPHPGASVWNAPDLDLRGGVLHNEAVYETAGGRRTLIRTYRCASLVDPHLLLQETAAAPENHWTEVALSASLLDPDLTARHPHLALL